MAKQRLQEIPLPSDVTGGRAFRYDHPGDLDGTPPQVARKATGDLEGAAATFARQVVAVCQQVRSGYMTEQLVRQPDLTPAQLAEQWDASDEALRCVRLIRTSRAMNTAVKQLRSGQEA